MRLDHLLIAGNRGVYKAAGLRILASSVVSVTNSTFAGNHAPLSPAIHLDALDGTRSTFELRNVIVRDNQDLLGTSQTILVQPRALLVVDWCSIEGGSSSIRAYGSGAVAWGGANSPLDPVFVDPFGADGDPLTASDNDYHLAAGSPCVDAGDVLAVLEDALDVDGDGDVFERVPLDLDRQPRFVDVPAAPDTGHGPAPIVDLGCFEQQR